MTNRIFLHENSLKSMLRKTKIYTSHTDSVPTFLALFKLPLTSRRLVSQLQGKWCLRLLLAPVQYTRSGWVFVGIPHKQPIWDCIFGLHLTTTPLLLVMLMTKVNLTLIPVRVSLHCITHLQWHRNRIFKTKNNNYLFLKDANKLGKWVNTMTALSLNLHLTFLSITRGKCNSFLPLSWENQSALIIAWSLYQPECPLPTDDDPLPFPRLHSLGA